MFDDGDFTKAVAQGGKSRIYPFEGDNVSFYTEQEFMQAASSFAPLALNTPDPDDPISFLVRETDPQDIGGGLYRFRRVYARIPVRRSEYKTIAYTFPGYSATFSESLQRSPYGVISELIVATDPGRPNQVMKVQCRVQYDYFLVGQGGSYATVPLIPKVTEQRYVYGSHWSVSGISGQDVQDRVIFPATIGALSVPTVEAYKALVTAGTEIVAENSELERWKGNIWQRTTSYVVAL